MVSRLPRQDGAQRFAEVVGGLRSELVRPQVRLEETPAPARIAPFAAALAADVVPGRAEDEDPLATGRFIVLHDPDEPEPWNGAWRIVTYARARVEPEIATDPLLGEVGWSWLTDALEAAGLSYDALGGTVTRVVSDGFAGLAHRRAEVDMEIRASWSPAGVDVPEHLRAWSEMLCTIAGLPPLPTGVTALPTSGR